MAERPGEPHFSIYTDAAKARTLPWLNAFSPSWLQHYSWHRPHCIYLIGYVLDGHDTAPGRQPCYINWVSPSRSSSPLAHARKLIPMLHKLLLHKLLL
jgi:hypothetical protein